MKFTAVVFGLITLLFAALLFGTPVPPAEAGMQSLQGASIGTASLQQVAQVKKDWTKARRVRVHWKARKRARRYQVLVHREQNDTLVRLRKIKGISKTKKTIKKLSPGLVYSIQVRAMRGKMAGPWSSSLRLMTKELPTEDDNGSGGDTGDGSGNDNDGDCISNQAPVFTADITDLSKINDIVPPPSYSGVLKTHSFLGITTGRVPVYAPVDSTLLSGAFYEEGNPGGEYTLEMQVTCEITYRFDHITEPVAALVDVFPDEPTESSQSQELTGYPSFEAGDLIGYTTGTIYGIWDFGVYNSEVENQFIDDPELNWTSVHTAAVCPYDFFQGAQREAYYTLFARASNRDFPDATDFCDWK